MYYGSTIFGIIDCFRNSEGLHYGVITNRKQFFPGHIKQNCNTSRATALR